MTVKGYSIDPRLGMAPGVVDIKVNHGRRACA